MNNKSSFENNIVVQAKRIHTNLPKSHSIKHYLEKDKNTKYKSLSKNNNHKEKKSRIKKSTSKFDLSTNKFNFNINQFQINKSKIKTTDFKFKKGPLQKSFLVMKPIKLNSTNNLDICYSNNNDKSNSNIINMKINNSKKFNIANINIKETSNNFFIGNNNYINNNIQNNNVQFCSHQKMSNHNKYSKVIHPKSHNISSNMNNCFSNKKIFKKRYKITKINITTDNNTSNSRNIKSSSYNNDIITDESKKETKNKNLSYNKSYMKQNNNKINNIPDKDSKSMFNLYKKDKGKKINTKKNNSYIIKNNNIQNNVIPQNINLQGNSISCSYPESYSFKDNSDGSLFSNPEIRNLAKVEDKNSTIEEKTERYIQILEKIIEKSQNPDTKFIFKFLKNEFVLINEEYLNSIKEYKDSLNKLTEKLSQTKKIDTVTDEKIEENEKEKVNSDGKMQTSKNYDLDESKQNSNKKDDEILEKNMNEITTAKKDSQFFFNLNKENVDDLDALYFLDKVNMSNNKNNSSNNKDKENNNQMNNYHSNNGDIIPFINLDPDYMESCKKKEFKKLEEKHLTQFQRIALQFEPS